jgi:hypothetical protein
VPRITWQARTTLLSGVITPLIAALCLWIWHYDPYWHDPSERLTVVGALATLLFVALPFPWVFGVVPGLISGGLYSFLLTRAPHLRLQIFSRGVVAAVLAGLVGGMWCQIVLGLSGISYGAVTAISGFLFALRWPRSGVAAPSNNRWRGP